MISEHEFANGYASIWNQVTPLSSGYWKMENMLLTRESPAVEARADKKMRGVVNEVAFRAFCALRPEGRRFDKPRLVAAVQANISDSIEYVARLAPAAKLEDQVFDDVCTQEAAELAGHLLGFFRGYMPTTLRPKFCGCGVVSACEGDVIEGNCLYEIKAGERQFRISDLRQLLVYSALAFSAGKLTFQRIGLVNPRTGVAWTRTLDGVCQSIAGARPVDVLSALVGHFSSASVSR